MIPGNPELYVIDESTRALYGKFLYPDNFTDSTELVDYEYGGIASQDPSEGFLYQIWKGWVDGSFIYIQPYDESAPPLNIITESGVVEFSFSFDQNMRWVAATRKNDNTVNLHWYDSSVEAYVITPYTGIVSIKLTHDDKRAVQVTGGSSDVIFTYIRNSSVRWRIQRDRYLTEYTHTGFSIPSNYRITNFGMNSKNRLQWRLGPRRIEW